MIYPDLPYVHALGDGGVRPVTQVAVIHATDNTASASAEASYARTRPDKTSAHFYIDDSTIIQALDTSHIAYGCLTHGNRISVQFELCGLSNRLSDATLRKAAPILARVCQDNGIPVRHLSASEVRGGIKGIVGHDGITLAFPEDNGDHMDPGSNFPWSTFISYVQGGDDVTPEEHSMLFNADGSAWGVYSLTDVSVIPGDVADGTPAPFKNALKAKLDAIEAKLDTGGVDLDVLAQKVSALLLPVVTAANAAAIADEIAKRLGNG